MQPPWPWPPISLRYLSVSAPRYYRRRNGRAPLGHCCHANLKFDIDNRLKLFNWNVPHAGHCAPRKRICCDLYHSDRTVNWFTLNELRQSKGDIPMSEHIRELTTQEVESVVGAVGGWAFAALNPQPIPPGRGDLVFGGS